ncbi:uncharacterized protein LOC110846614 [Folsomia candida]|uniref:uncharacterized protein LOC110846614 n=1 Tax=Folsomia candida TaxID=158441 RepID=UPI000B8FF502|nr:uncharacterized protein LOC110846614 [Folsomia candida]
MIQIQGQLIIFIGVLALVYSQSIDETLTPRSKGADVSEAVVRKIQRSGIFPHDQNLLRRLSYVESRDGEDDKTYRPDYFGGIWQLDEVLFNQTKNVPGLNTIYQRLDATWNIQWNSVTWADLLVPMYSGLGARLYLHTLSLSNRPIPGTIDSQAEYWRLNYNRADQNATTYKDLVKRLESDGGVCEGLMDICIVLDGSRSIGAGAFIRAKGFVADLVQTFSLNSTRVAFVLYSDNAQKIFDFSNTLTPSAMNTTIRNVRYPNGNTNTPAGLLMAVTFFNQATPRPGVPQVVATFTDGNSNRGNLTVAVAAVKTANLTSFAVGIGNEQDIRESELQQIALNDSSRVFRVNDYEALAEFFFQMNKATCEVPQEPEIGDEHNGTLNKNEKRYFKYQIPDAGFTLNLLTSGQISGWYSYTEQTPNSAVHDGLILTHTFIQSAMENSVVHIALQGDSVDPTEYNIRTDEGNQVTSTTPQSTTTYTTSTTPTSASSTTPTSASSTTPAPTSSTTLETTTPNSAKNVIASIGVAFYLAITLCVMDLKYKW